MNSFALDEEGKVMRSFVLDHETPSLWTSMIQGDTFLNRIRILMQYNVYLFKRFNLWLSIGYNFRRLLLVGLGCQVAAYYGRD